MEYGVLYHSRYKHPIVDAVGILKRIDKIKYHLVFIQISMSKYYSHSSKIEDLYESVDCMELKNHQYYIYVYIYIAIRKNY